jgi:hypothetical protein
MKIKPEFVGEWWIIEMSEWERDFIDLVAPGYLTIKTNGTGAFAFGAFESEIDCRVEKTGGQEWVAFSFAGWDEGDEVSGRGWAIVNGKKMEGWIGFFLGEESTFKSVKRTRKK